MERGKSEQVSLDNQCVSTFARTRIHDNKQVLPLGIIPVNSRKTLTTDLAQIQLKPKGTLLPLQKLVSPTLFPHVAHETVTVENNAMILRDGDVDRRLQVSKNTRCDLLVALALLLVRACKRHNVHIVVVHVLQLLLSVRLDEREQEVPLRAYPFAKEDMS